MGLTTKLRTERDLEMDGWMQAVLVILAYVVLMRWVLPRFGVQT